MSEIVLPHRLVSVSRFDPAPMAGHAAGSTATGTGPSARSVTNGSDVSRTASGQPQLQQQQQQRRQPQQTQEQSQPLYHQLSFLPFPSLSSLSLSEKPARVSTSASSVTAGTSILDAVVASTSDVTNSTPSNQANLSNLPTELILHIFARLAPRAADAFALSKTNCRLRAVFTAHTDRIFLMFAPRCLPCYPDALALAELQLRLRSERKDAGSEVTTDAGGDGGEGLGCSSLGATLRRNHRVVFRAARHAMAREGVQSKFRLAIDRPDPKGISFELDDHTLVDQIDEQCKLAISIDYSINRLLLAPLRECVEILTEIVDKPEQPGTIPITLRMLRLSVLLRAKSYSDGELKMYFVSERADWEQLLAEISAHMRRIREATAVRAVD